MKHLQFGEWEENYHIADFYFLISVNRHRLNLPNKAWSQAVGTGSKMTMILDAS